MTAVQHHQPNYYEQKYGQLKALWLWVIERAVRDYALWKKSRKPLERKAADSARYYLFEDGGFVEICTVFDLPIHKIRQRAINLTPEEIKKIERVERTPSKTGSGCGDD